MQLLELTSLILPCLFIIISYYVFVAIYRSYFHPLAKFPGPRLAAITWLYEMYYDVALNGRYTFQIAKLHKEYGPIVRISPSELHINDADFYEKLYRHDGRWDRWSWPYDSFGVPSSTVSTGEHYLHRQRRTPLNPYFSKSSVASRQDMVGEKVAKLRKRIELCAVSNSVINLGAALSAVATDVATEYVLGTSYNDLDREDFNEPMSFMAQGLGVVWRWTKFIWFTEPLIRAVPLSWMEKIGSPDMKAFVAYLLSSARETQRLFHDFRPNASSETKSPRNLVHVILSSDTLAPSQKQLQRVTDELFVVTGAGFETVAQTLRYTIYNLYSDPLLLEKLRLELRTNTNTESPDDTRLTQLEQLPILTSVLKEGLRLSPGVGSRLARIAPDREIIFADKWKIPAGTPVGMTALLMHRDEDNFRDAESFKPERWMDRKAVRELGLEKRFAPFSKGTRNCLGMHLAWAELYMVLAMIVLHFDFDFVGLKREDVEPSSDQFVIGTKAKSRILAVPKLCKT